MSVEDFEAIVREHRGTVYRVARRMLRSHEEADDVTQETFVRAWRALPGFRGDAPVRAWLLRIALNLVRNRVSRRPPEDPLDDSFDPGSTGRGAEAESEREEARSAVRRAVAGLPPRQREVVILKVFSEMTYEDVAGAMGLTPGAVKAHLHQAVANLRRRMAGEATEKA